MPEGLGQSISARTYKDAAHQRITALCTALELPADRQQALFALAAHAMPFGERAVGDSPQLLSDITDDHTPFELSVAFRGDDADVRLLVENLPWSPRIDARWRAGLDLMGELARRYPIDTTRFGHIAPAFTPSDEWARFAIWFAANVGKRTSFKAYLNPAAHGRHRASTTVRQALQWLGMGDVWQSIPKLRRGLDEVKYFSIDLDDARGARVKVYFSHRSAGIDTLEGMLAAAPGYRAGDVEDFCRTLSAGEGAYEALPVQTCYAFTAGQCTPTDVALHFPVRAYAKNDAEALSRISALLRAPHRTRYGQMVQAYVGNDLTTRRGVQTYASFWAGKGIEDVTVYLSPQLFGTQPALQEQGYARFPMSERSAA